MAKKYNYKEVVQEMRYPTAKSISDGKKTIYIIKSDIFYIVFEDDGACDVSVYDSDHGSFEEILYDYFDNHKTIQYELKSLRTIKFE